MGIMNKCGSVAASVLFLGAALAASTPAAATHDNATFELDGNVADGTPGFPLDWESTPLQQNPVLLDGSFAADYPKPDASYHKDSDKDITEIEGQWTCELRNSPQPKTEILNNYIALLRNDAGNLQLLSGVERATSNGNGFMGFWLVLDEVGCDPATGRWKGFHTEDDLLLLSNFTGGGKFPGIDMYRWNPAFKNNLEYLGTNRDCSVALAGDAGCGAVNAAPMGTPWPPNDAGTLLAKNTFMEWGLDLNLAAGITELPCISTFLAETRSSQEPNAQLKDFTVAYLERCDATITITPASAVNPVGTQHTMWVTVLQKSDWVNFVPAAGVQVDAALDGPGSFVGDDFCVTLPNGSCSLTITSPEAGLSTVTASVDLVIDGFVLHRETDGQLANSGPAEKQWVKVPSTTLTTPTPPAIVFGEGIQDRAEVSGEVGPGSGNVTFFVCAAGVEPCLFPLGDSLGKHLLDETGVALSDEFIPPAPGRYCFRGDYEGDAAYLPSSDASEGECFDVAKAPSDTTTTPSDPTVVLGGLAHDTADVTGLDGGPVPTGTVSFYACGPEVFPCTDAGLALGTKDLDEAGHAESDAFAPSAPGEWCFLGAYSGDANYDASADSSTGECFDVTRAPSTTTTFPSSTEFLVGGSTTDLASVAGNDVGGVPTGSVTFFVCATDIVPCPWPDGDELGADDLNETGWAESSSFAPTEPGTYCFRAEYEGDGDYLPSNESSVAECFLVTFVDSSLVKAVRVLPDGAFGPAVAAEPGDSLEYRLVYTNDGTGDATNVNVTDPVPPKTTFDACEPAPCGVEAGVVWFDLGTVADGADPITVLFRVTLDEDFPSGTTRITNQGNVTSDQDAERSNAAIVDVTTTPESHLAKGVRVNGEGDFADAADAAPGDTLQYRLVYSNTGDAPATEVKVEDRVPEHTTYLDCSPLPCGIDVGTGNVTWDVGTVEIGGERALFFNVTLDDTIDEASIEVRNVGGWTNREEGRGTSNEVVVTVRGTPGFRTDKSVDPTTVAAGGTLHYKVTVTNIGDGPGSTPVVDTYDENVTVDESSIDPAGTHDADARTITWTSDTLLPDGSQEFRFDAVAAERFFGDPGDACPDGQYLVENEASAGGSTANADACVDAPPAWDVEKSASPEHAAPGGVVTYTIVVTNTGAGPGSTPVVDSYDPSATLLEGSSAPPGDEDAASYEVRWTTDVLDPLASQEFSFQVRLPDVYAGERETTGECAGEFVVPNDVAVDGDEDSADVCVDARPRILLQKSADSETAVAGGLVTYTIEYVNLGNATAHDTEILEPLPANTAFEACDPECDEGPPVTWQVGDVGVGEGGSVTLTVRVDEGVEDCRVCNVAEATSRDQIDTSLSNEVCLDVAADPDDANASGQALDVHIVTTGMPLQQLDLDEIVGPVASSAQSGPGTTTSAPPPEFTTPTTLDPTLVVNLLSAFSTSNVSAASGSARSFSVAEVADVSVLGGLVGTSEVRAMATAYATGSNAWISTAGSHFDRVTIEGVEYHDVAPNTRVDLTSLPGSYVTLFETSGGTTFPGGLGGGTYEADLTVIMVHVHIVDALPLVAGLETIDIQIARADAHADYPQAPVCARTPASVSGHAFAYDHETTPAVAPTTVGYVWIPPWGGDDVSDTASEGGAVDPAENGPPVSRDVAPTGADASDYRTESHGTIDDASADAFSEARVQYGCGYSGVEPPPIGALIPGCLVEATSIHTLAQAHADADGAWTYGWTVIEDLRIAGIEVCDLANADGTCSPPENEVVIDLGFAFVILNEQIPDSGGSDAGITVRGVRIVFTTAEFGVQAGTEIIIAESHADASWGA
ncbi:MAG TPA: choice-of-anchor P family protein [Candidatus Thermoplasmatota archaeon]|nr:choice-of-anchor P family protein [Candidatus Thermoplasmatota archaeon]